MSILPHLWDDIHESYVLCSKCGMAKKAYETCWSCVYNQYNQYRYSTVRTEREVEDDTVRRIANWLKSEGYPMMAGELSKGAWRVEPTVIRTVHTDQDPGDEG